MKLHHIALWVRDLEQARAFYTSALGAVSGPLYESRRSGMRSYFLSFESGAQIELMADSTRADAPTSPLRTGYTHIALAAASRAAVDEAIARLRARGVPVLGEPRVTGDGYYEAVISDPEGNEIEIVA
jgi:lactoylglutathione lyase